MVAVQGVAEWHCGVELVAVAATFADPIEVARVLEFGDDALGSTLRDSNKFRKISEADVRVVGDAEEHVRVVGEECPVRHSADLSGVDRKRYLHTRIRIQITCYGFPVLDVR